MKNQKNIPALFKTKLLILFIETKKVQQSTVAFSNHTTQNIYMNILLHLNNKTIIIYNACKVFYSGKKTHSPKILHIKLWHVAI